jgi:hypothetical protein
MNIHDLTTAMCLGLAALFVRRFGHAILEPPCHDKEKLLLEYNTRNKTLIVLGYILIALVHLQRACAWSCGIGFGHRPDCAALVLLDYGGGIRTRGVSDLAARFFGYR